MKAQDDRAVCLLHKSWVIWPYSACLFSKVAKTCYFTLTYEYFDAIEAGSKEIEFRANTEKTQKRLEGCSHIIFSRGLLVANSNFIMYCIVTVNQHVMGQLSRGPSQGRSNVRTAPRAILTITEVSREIAYSLGCPHDPSGRLFGDSDTLLAIKFERVSKQAWPCACFLLF